MSAGLRGDIGKIRTLERAIRELPRVVGAQLATASATTITTLARQTFAAGQNAYGDTWAPGYDGKRVDLRETGRLASGVKYVAIGTRLRAALPVDYAKFVVGKRPIFPTGKLPLAYSEALRANAAKIIGAELARGQQ
jgi:hypothetical protein